MSDGAPLLRPAAEWDGHGLVANLPFVDGSELCAQTDPEIFFPEKGGSVREARMVCSRCPLELPCLDYAVHHPVAGIWGGTSYAERRDLAHSMGLPYGDPLAVTALYAGPLPGERPEDFRDPDDDLAVGSTAAIRAWANRNGYSGYLPSRGGGDNATPIPIDIQVAYWEALAAREEQAS